MGTFVQGQRRRGIDFRGAELTRQGWVSGDGDWGAMSLASFVKDGDGVDGGAGGVCWDVLAGAVGREGDGGVADEPSS